MSQCDAGFYNCNAMNAEGFASASSEVEVTPLERASLHHVKRHSRKEPRPPYFIEVLPGKLEVSFALNET